MTEREAADLASRALPCPFCGAALVVEATGLDIWPEPYWWAIHPDGNCYGFALKDEQDLRRWNTRGGQPCVGPAGSEGAWSTTLPQSPGRYWWRNPASKFSRKHPDMITVRLQDCVASEFDGQLVCDEPYTRTVADKEGEWAGPVMPPGSYGKVTT